MRRIYLDYAATTPIDPLVAAVMKPYFSAKFGNPGSLHFFGQQAIAAVDEARETVAKAIGAPAGASLGGGFREIIFTGSATEANNLALRGAVRSFLLHSNGTGRPSAPAVEGDLRSRHSDVQSRLDDQAPNASESYHMNATKISHRVPLLGDRGRKRIIPRILVSAVEHESVLETARDLAREGVEVMYIPVDRTGMIDVDFVRRNLNGNTVLVSVVYVNNEIGTIEPVHELTGIVEEFKERIARREGTNVSPWPLIHTDAVQAFQYIDCGINRLRVDMMTLSGHKLYGPKGIGVLYAKQIANSQGQIANGKWPIVPLLTGGGQEFGLRSGTENVSAIVGFAKAVERAARVRAKEAKRVTLLRDYFWHHIRASFKGVELNGSATHRIANNLNVYFPDMRAEDILTKLDLAGVAVSAGSACSSRAAKLSSTLLACGLPEHRIQSSVRFSLGAGTTKGQINEAIKRMKVLKK